MFERLRPVSSSDVRAGRRVIARAVAWAIVSLLIASSVPAFQPPSAEIREDVEGELEGLAERTRALRRAGEHEKAVASGERWAELAARAEDDLELVRARAEVGFALSSLDRDREAADLLELAIAEMPSVGLTRLESFELHLEAADALVDLARFGRARPLVDHAADLAEELGDPILRARALAVRGNLAAQSGDDQGAYRLRTEVVAAYEEAGDEVRLARALYSLGRTSISLHDYAAGVSHLRRALELGTDERVARFSRISLAIAHYELNQLDEAERTFLEVLEDAEASGDLVNVAWATGELGLVAKQRGDNEEALEWCDRAIELSGSLGDLRNQIVWMSNKGIVLRNLGRHREALELYRRTRELDRAVGIVFLDRFLSKLEGESWSALGEDEVAEPLLRKASRLSLEAEDWKVVWESERELSRLYRRRGEPDRALASLLTALDVIERIRGSLQLESFKRDFFEDKVAVYGQTIDLLTGEAGLARGVERAFEIAERARARAFLDTLAESRAELEQTLPASYRERERELLEAISELQAEVREGRVESRAEAEAESESLEAALEAVELEVRERFPRFRDMRGAAPADLETVREELAPGEVLLSYFVAEPFSHLWAVDGGGVRHWRLDGSAALEARVRSAFARLSRPTSAPRLDELAEALLGPWLDLGIEPDSLVIVPSGVLHFVPFAALPVGTERTLGDLAPTSYAPSAATWLELRRRPVEPADPMLLALGDAVRGDVADRLRAVADLAALRTLGELPHSRAEVETVASVFGRGAATVLLGEEATESRLVASTPGHSVVHLATHGWIDPTKPSASGLVVGADPATGDDGILQLREIVRLDLAADLVTLSACESALGELVTGEGMVGLARSFFYAGADSVLATLWSVDDATSARFMEAFYRALRRGASKAEALQRARAEIRSDPETSHPYYWAPYVLLGRGDDGVAMPVRGLSGWGIAASLLLGAGLAVWVVSRRR